MESKIVNRDHLSGYTCIYNLNDSSAERAVTFKKWGQGDRRSKTSQYFQTVRNCHLYTGSLVYRSYRFLVIYSVINHTNTLYDVLSS